VAMVGLVGAAVGWKRCTRSIISWSPSDQPRGRTRDWRNWWTDTGVKVQVEAVDEGFGAFVGAEYGLSQEGCARSTRRPVRRSSAKGLLWWRQCVTSSGLTCPS